MALGAALVTLLGFLPLCGESEFPLLPAGTLERFPPQVRQQVEQAYSQARQKPDDARLIGELGMLMHANEQYNFARICYRRAHNLEPDSFRWAYYLGVLQSLSGQNEAAIVSLHKAVRLDPAYLPARLKLAEALFAAGRLNESGRLYQAALEEYPDLPISHYGLGRVKAAGGDLVAAISHYRKACDLFQGFGAAHYALALAYRDLGETHKARKHFSLYQNSKAGQPDIEGPLLKAVKALGAGARYHLTEAIRLESENRIQESIREHQKALELDPELVQAHLNLLSLYGRLRQWDRAQEHFRAAIQINPNLVEAHYNHGVLLTHQGRYDEAGRAFRRALEIDPFYADAHYNLGQILERLGQIGAAERHYRQAIENGPTHRLARFNLGRMLAAQKKNKEAVQQFLQILTPTDQHTPHFMYALAVAYIRSGDLEKGSHYAREAKQMAQAFGQDELVSAIEKDLQQLNPTKRRQGDKRDP